MIMNEQSKLTWWYSTKRIVYILAFLKQHLHIFLETGETSFFISQDTRRHTLYSAYTQNLFNNTNLNYKKLSVENNFDTESYKSINWHTIFLYTFWKGSYIAISKNLFTLHKIYPIKMIDYLEKIPEQNLNVRLVKGVWEETSIIHISDLTKWSDL